MNLVVSIEASIFALCWL